MYNETLIAAAGALLITIFVYIICKMKIRNEKAKAAEMLKEKEAEIKKLIEKDNEKTIFRTYSGRSEITKQRGSSGREESRKGQKFLRYTSEGFISVDEDKNKRIFRWR